MALMLMLPLGLPLSPVDQQLDLLEVCRQRQRRAARQRDALQLTPGAAIKCHHAPAAWRHVGTDRPTALGSDTDFKPVRELDLTRLLKIGTEVPDR